jgi:class 3 adenylate cyclase
MSSLPSGTVTFVFSDIEGSTTLLKALGDAYADVLSGHRELMRDCFTARGGVEIDTQGDAFFFAFSRARDAVAAAVDAQRAHVAHAWPQGKTLSAGRAISASTSSARRGCARSAAAARSCCPRPRARSSAARSPTASPCTPWASGA